MIDTDGSGALDEREFVAYWIYAIGPGENNNKIKIGKLGEIS